MIEAKKSQFVFYPFENIYKCWFGIRSPQHFTIGKFTPKLFIDEEKVKAWKGRRSHSIEKCSKCKYSFICGGGCAEKAWEEVGRIDRPRCIDFARILGEFARYLLHNDLIHKL